MRGKRLLFTGPKRVEWVERDLPEPQGDQLLVRTVCTLISPGTERAALVGLHGGYPYGPGYSSVAVVAAAGARASEHGIACGDVVVGGGNHATHNLLRASEVQRLPAGLPPERAVFMELAVIALQGVRKARIELGEPVLVVGAGLVGLLAVQLAAAAGAMPAVTAERDAFRLALAERCGVEHRIEASESGQLPPAAVQTVTRGRGFPVVIEATGYPEAVDQALSAASPRGRVVLLGSTRGSSTVDFYERVHLAGVTVLGAHNSVRPTAEDTPGYWTKAADARCALDLLGAGRLNVEPLITDRVRAEQLPGVYKRLAEWDPTLIAAVVSWEPRA